LKLGKLAPKHDPRTLHLANYLDTEKLPTIPKLFDWSGKVAQWGMLANDRLGDCTCASAGHLIETWTANASTEIVPSDADIIAAYSAVSGYDPATGENDNGAVELDVLNYWRRTGIANHKIFAYAACEPRNHSHVKAAVYLFGGCYIGLALPLSAQNQAVWSVPSWGLYGSGRPGSWGGHAVNVVAYDQHFLTVVTWGALQRMTWGFWDHYTDESYAVLSQDFINGGIAPNAIDWASLQKDLGKVAH
jgi:hypothetical protein